MNILENNNYKSSIKKQFEEFIQNTKDTAVDRDFLCFCCIRCKDDYSYPDDCSWNSENQDCLDAYEELKFNTYCETHPMP